MTDPVVAPGAVLAGKYRVERVLGQGGMGVVVQATHLQLGQPVAMKFLLPEVLGNPQVVQRFLREAQAVVRLKSEHVARVIDVGSLDTGAPYIVLEYLEGADLASVPRSQLTVGGVVDLVLRACEALAEAHALGIVHRDLKPANFFLTRRADGTPLLKVLDFGISKIAAASGPLTATQVVMGTPGYMSPEQMRSSRRVDHRSDIWSLGVVLYELLQGAPPFRDDEFSAMVLKVVNDPLPRLTVQLPGDLDRIIYRCLEKDPARRFPDVAELARALATYAGSKTQAAISMQRTRGVIGAEPARAVLAPATAPRSAPSTLSGSAGERTMRLRGGRRWPVAAAMGVVAGSIVLAVVAASGPDRTEAPRRGPRPEGELSTASAPGPDTTRPLSRPPLVTAPSAPPPSAATGPRSPPTSTPSSASASPVATAPPSPASPVATAPGQRSAPPRAGPPDDAPLHHCGSKRSRHDAVRVTVGRVARTRRDHRATHDRRETQGDREAPHVAGDAPRDTREELDVARGAGVSGRTGGVPSREAGSGSGADGRTLREAEHSFRAAADTA